jgi:5,5'-dehydrodivanillate O-demethylase
MLSQEMNETLTKVGSGTPCGQLLRRYWQPVCIASELTEEKPKKRVKVMEEDLVIFRDGDGRYGCVAEQCAHRGCSLYYGFIEKGGLRCAYHGWKFDVNGQCLEQPFEPKGSKYKEQICQTSYPVQKLGGLLFIYMGPQPAPMLPRWDVLVREDGYLKLQQHPILNCNWLQAQENSVDTVHTYYLHGHTMHLKNMPMAKYYYRPIEKYDFELCEWGMIKRRTFKGEKEVENEKGHPAVFPNMLRVPEGKTHAFHWRVPIDDTHTMIFWAGFVPTEDGSIPERPVEPPVEEMPPLMKEDGEYAMDSFPSQDKMAWETQGPLYDRTKEHLGASDRGVAMWRKLLREQIEIVRGGGEPMALVRDPAKNEMIDFETSDGQARKEFVEPMEALNDNQ